MPPRQGYHPLMGLESGFKSGLDIGLKFRGLSEDREDKRLTREQKQTNVDRTFKATEKNRAATLKQGEKKLTILESKGTPLVHYNKLIDKGLKKLMDPNLPENEKILTKSRIAEFRAAKEKFNFIKREKPGRPIQIFDPESPTKTTFVDPQDAIGQPGKPPSGMRVSVSKDGTVTFEQGRGINQNLQAKSNIKKKEKFEEAEIAVEIGRAGIREIRSMLKGQNGEFDSSILSATGGLSRISNTLRAQGTALSKLFGIDDLSPLDVKKYQDKMTKIGIRSAVLQSAIISLAYMQAVSLNNGSSRISDKDFKFALDTLGSNTGDARTFDAVLGSLDQRMQTGLEIRRRILFPSSGAGAKQGKSVQGMSDEELLR